MSPELVSILVLIAMFAAATVLPVNMGALAFVVALVGTAYTDFKAEGIALLFQGALFALLVGVTCLFAIAQGNGTITWPLGASVRAVGGRSTRCRRQSAFDQWAIVLGNSVDVDKKMFFEGCWPMAQWSSRSPRFSCGWS